VENIGGKNLWGQKIFGGEKSLGGTNRWGGKIFGGNNTNSKPFAHDCSVGHLVDVAKNFAKGKLLRDSKKLGGGITNSYLSRTISLLVIWWTLL